MSSDNNDKISVYSEQIKLLYQQIPVALLASMLMACIFAYTAWAPGKETITGIWLGLHAVVILIGFLCYRAFDSTGQITNDLNKCEFKYLIVTLLLAVLWASTSIWLKPDSPSQQIAVQLILISALITVAITTLTPRIVLVWAFLTLVFLSYAAKFAFLNAQSFYSIVSLATLYYALTIYLSIRINSKITKSLQLKINNYQLLSSYEESNELNTKANDALFELFKKNKDKELKLEKSESFLRAILDTANDSIITTDRKGKILTVNHAIERDFGYTADEMIGRSINIIMDKGMGPKHDKYMEQYFQSDKPVLLGRMLDVTGLKKDGSSFPLEITVSETRVDSEIFFTGIIRDTTERKAQEGAMEAMMIELAHAKRELESANSQLYNKNKELTELSEHDDLTNLPNRRYLQKAFTKEWPRHQRHKRPIAVIMMDIDFFKKYNDHYGHQAGDVCLQKIAQSFIKNISRPADFIARYGGEEFIAVLPETNLLGAYYIAEKMRTAVAELNISHDDSPTGYVTISAGIASMTPNIDNHPDDLIKQSDDALYAAKDNGRNRICQSEGPPNIPEDNKTNSG